MKKFKAVYLIEAEDESEAEAKFSELDLETIKDGIIIEED